MKWQTRTLAEFIALTVPVEKAGAVNPLLDYARKIGEPPSDEEKEAAKNPVNEPQPGSYERFMHTFGNPQRWAGH